MDIENLWVKNQTLFGLHHIRHIRIPVASHERHIHEFLFQLFEAFGDFHDEFCSL